MKRSGSRQDPSRHGQCAGCKRAPHSPSRNPPPPALALPSGHQGEAWKSGRQSSTSWRPLTPGSSCSASCATRAKAARSQSSVSTSVSSRSAFGEYQTAGHRQQAWEASAVTGGHGGGEHASQAVGAGGGRQRRQLRGLRRRRRTKEDRPQHVLEHRQRAGRAGRQRRRQKSAQARGRRLCWSSVCDERSVRLPRQWKRYEQAGRRSRAHARRRRLAWAAGGVLGAPLLGPSASAGPSSQLGVLLS